MTLYLIATAAPPGLSRAHFVMMFFFRLRHTFAEFTINLPDTSDQLSVEFNPDFDIEQKSGSGCWDYINAYYFTASGSDTQFAKFCGKRTSSSNPQCAYPYSSSNCATENYIDIPLGSEDSTYSIKVTFGDITGADASKGRSL